MVEVIPANPFNSETGIDSIRRQFDCSKKHINQLLKKGEQLLSLGVIYLSKQFPILGQGDYFEKFEGDREEFLNNPYSESGLVHDEIMTKHPRFPTLVQNIRQRRERKVHIEIPIFPDFFTK